MIAIFFLQGLLTSLLGMALVWRRISVSAEIPGSADLIPGYPEKIPGYLPTGIHRQTVDSACGSWHEIGTFEAKMNKFPIIAGSTGILRLREIRRPGVLGLVTAQQSVDRAGEG